MQPTPRRTRVGVSVHEACLIGELCKHIQQQHAHRPRLDALLHQSLHIAALAAQQAAVRGQAAAAVGNGQGTRSGAAQVGAVGAASPEACAAHPSPSR